MKSLTRTSAVTSQVGPGKLQPARFRAVGRATFDNLPVELRLALADGLRPGGEAGPETNGGRQDEVERTLLEGLIRTLARTHAVASRRRATA